MTLWLILTVMTSAAAVVLSAPFIRRLDQTRIGSAGEIEVYRDQLREVERELRQGHIDEQHADLASVEIKRRVLSIKALEQPAKPRLTPIERNFAMLGVTGIVVLGSVGLYGITEGQRASPEPFATAELIPENEPQSPSRTSIPPVEDMVQRLAARLSQNPDDAEGWRMLGWSYFNTDRFSEAAEAYAKAIELAPDIAELRGSRLEALIRAANGIVTAGAKIAIDETLKLDPKDVSARLFMGVAKQQAGDLAAAVADWKALLKDANSDEPWAADLRNKISELEQGTANTHAVAAAPELATSLSPADAESQPLQTYASGPSPRDVRTADALPPADRSAMIRGMVDRLASRLEQSPRDVNGWIKLIRARMVLGESELARQALTQGLEAFGTDPPERERIVAAAQQLGLNR
jgi:cytochrome c-type biogenesis protein CcmH